MKIKGVMVLAIAMLVGTVFTGCNPKEPQDVMKAPENVTQTTKGEISTGNSKNTKEDKVKLLSNLENLIPKALQWQKFTAILRIRKTL